MKKFLSFVCFLSLSAALLAGCTLVSRDPSVSQELLVQKELLSASLSRWKPQK